jgi:Pyridoxamine 5'-phosphate oxidase
MPPTQGDPALLTDPIAQELLHSTHLARLAYTSPAGAPRVVPIWFHWTGEELVLGTPADAPKVAALEADPAVAITIDSEGWPPHALLLRGQAHISMVDGVPAEYAAAARRYLGEEQGSAWASQAAQLMGQSARIAIRPEWVTILDFETRFPSALARKMGQG